MMKEEFCARAKVEENELSNEDYEVIEDEIRSIGRQISELNAKMVEKKYQYEALKK